MCLRCDSWPDKRIPIIEYKVRRLLPSAAQIELSATQIDWRCQGWHGLSLRLCASLFTHLWKFVCARCKCTDEGRTASKMLQVSTMALKVNCLLETPSLSKEPDDLSENTTIEMCCAHRRMVYKGQRLQGNFSMLK